jgi:hypothetical protein
MVSAVGTGIGFERRVDNPARAGKAPHNCDAEGGESQSRAGKLDGKCEKLWMEEDKPVENMAKRFKQTVV